MLNNSPLQTYGDAALSDQNFRDLWKRVRNAEYNVGKYKNHIIGGDFTTNPWQRGTSFAAAPTASYSADRWRIDYVTSAVVTVQKTADAPSIFQTGGYFSQHCLDIDVTTADAAVAAGDYFTVTQRIEGLNSSHFGFGQSPGAKYVCLSFWIKTGAIGVYGVSLRNSARDRCYTGIFYVENADTWEYKSLNIPVDNTGTWLYTNGIGIEVSFCLMAGTTFQRADASCNAWAADNLFAPASQVNALANTSYNFKLDLVQLTEAYAPVSFEYRPVQYELELCQRYLPAWNWSTVNDVIGIGYSIGTTDALIVFHSPVTPRTKPTGVTVTNATNIKLANGSNVTGAITGLTYSIGGSLSAQLISAAHTAGSPTTAAGEGALLLGTAASQILFTGCEL